jgi:hypothetical protein
MIPKPGTSAPRTRPFQPLPSGGGVSRTSYRSPTAHRVPRMITTRLLR